MGSKIPVNCQAICHLPPADIIQLVRSASTELVQAACAAGLKVRSWPSSAGITDLGHKCGRIEHPDAGYVQQAARARVLLRRLGKLGFESGDPLVECSLALLHISDEPIDAAAKHWFVYVKQLG